MLRAFYAVVKHRLESATCVERDVLVANFLREWDFDDNAANRAVFAEYCATGVLIVPLYIKDEATADE